MRRDPMKWRGRGGNVAMPGWVVLVCDGDGDMEANDENEEEDTVNVDGCAYGARIWETYQRMLSRCCDVLGGILAWSHEAVLKYTRFGSEIAKP